MSDKDSIRVLRIFVAWPSDVKAERDLAEKVIKDLNKVFKDRDCQLEMVDWIKSVPPGPGNPEDRILEKTEPETWNVFLGVLWTRFGSLPHLVNTKTGKLSRSGFEAEYLHASALWEVKGRPHIMLYRCTKPKATDEIDVDQLKLVQQFFQEIEKRYELLYQRYDSLEEFEKRLAEDLHNVINEIITPEARKPQFPHSISFEKFAEETDFSNRQNELTRISTVLTTDFAASLMICAPSGMGKSRLKNRLNEVLNPKNLNPKKVEKNSLQYHLIQLDCRKDTSLCSSIEAFEQGIYERLMIPAGNAVSKDFRKQIGIEAAKLMQQNKRLIILLDCIELLPPALLAFIRNELLPGLHSAVKKASYYPAMIAFGRIYPLEWRGGRGVRFEAVELSAFRKPIIEEILHRKTEERNLTFSDEDHAEWSENILRISHGHPRCIVNLVSWLYEEYFAPPTAFDTDEAFASFVIPVIEREILSEDNLAPLEAIPNKIETAKRLRKVLPYVCVFRFYAAAHLRILANCGVIEEAETDKLEELLSRTFLIDPPRQRPWYKPHEVIRRLMGDMLFHREPKTFQKINQQACKTYDAWILGEPENAPPNNSRHAQDEIQVHYIVEGLYHHNLARKKTESIRSLKNILDGYLVSLHGVLPRKNLFMMLYDFLLEDEELRQLVNQRGKPDDYEALLAMVESAK